MNGLSFFREEGPTQLVMVVHVISLAFEEKSPAMTHCFDAYVHVKLLSLSPSPSLEHGRENGPVVCVCFHTTTAARSWAPGGSLRENTVAKVTVSAVGYFTTSFFVSPIAACIIIILVRPTVQRSALPRPLCFEYCDRSIRST